MNNAIDHELDSLESEKGVTVLYAPLRFSELSDAKLDPAIAPLVAKLLDEKTNEPECETRPRIDALNTWIERWIGSIEGELANIETLKRPRWDHFDEVFRTIVLGS